MTDDGGNRKLVGYWALHNDEQLCGIALGIEV